MSLGTMQQRNTRRQRETRVKVSPTERAIAQAFRQGRETPLVLLKEDLEKDPNLVLTNAYLAELPSARFVNVPKTIAHPKARDAYQRQFRRTCDIIFAIISKMVKEQEQPLLKEALAAIETRVNR